MKKRIKRTKSFRPSFYLNYKKPQISTCEDLYTVNRILMCSHSLAQLRGPSLATKLTSPLNMVYSVDMICCIPNLLPYWGTRQRSWLRHYITSRKVAGSILVEIIGFFYRLNSSSRAMALGSTQPLTEMSTKNLPGGGAAKKAVSNWLNRKHTK
jgi:hypothetical protein